MLVKNKDKQQTINLVYMDKDYDGYVLKSFETYDPPTVPLDESD